MDRPKTYIDIIHPIEKAYFIGKDRNYVHYLVNCLVNLPLDKHVVVYYQLKGLIISPST